jgi:chromosome segregation ATPase
MSANEKKSALLKASTQLQEVMSLLDTLKTEYPELYEKVADLEKTNQELQKGRGAAEKEVDQLRSENQKMKSELENVSQELGKVSKEFEHLTKEKDVKVETRKILALSITLLTEVFGAMPHSKLLFLLHGQKAEMSRDALAKASGISPAVVRKALADLKSAMLVDYDVETGQVKLLKRIYES